MSAPRKIFMIILVILFVLVSIAAIIIHYLKNQVLDKDGMVNRYRVVCDEKAFTSTRTDFMFVPGYDVFLKFPMKTRDKDYTFEADGVDDFEANFYPGYGYLIRFEMPDHQVAINYSEKDTNTLSDPVSNINIVLDENPSTGFQVEADITPDGIVEADGDWYVGDPQDPRNPTDGSGGNHFFHYKIVGNGTVELRFSWRRGEEQLEGKIIYTYQCDKGVAKLLKKDKQ